MDEAGLKEAVAMGAAAAVIGDVSLDEAEVLRAHPVDANDTIVRHHFITSVGHVARADSIDNHAVAE